MSRPAQSDRAASMLQGFHAALYQAYGPQYWWPARTRLEVIVGAYLTQATARTSVERSIANLRRAGCLSLAGLRRTPDSKLRALIRPSGFARRKAASLRAFVNYLDAQHGGSLARLSRQNPAQTRQQLLALPGVGAETADAILTYALGHPALVIDTYLRRVAHRHGLIPAARERFDPELRAAAQRLLTASTPAVALAEAQEFHALIVAVGKRHCRAQAQCSGCPLEGFLPGASAKAPQQHFPNA
jgi:endonuclease-3 related protein